MNNVEIMAGDDATEWYTDPIGEFNSSLPGLNNKKQKMSENNNQERVLYTQWLKEGPDTFTPTDNSTTQKVLDHGVYNIRYTERKGIYVFKKSLNLDEIIDLPSKESDEVLNGIRTFWKREDKFKEYGFTYKRGVLLYGVPGGGKTTIINQLADHIVNTMNGLVFYISQTNELDLYYKFSGEILRVIEPTRPILVVLEDIDGLCSFKENETTLLNILDGANQINNVVYIATTNYISRLPERIVNRPSRFDLRVEVKYPSKEARRIFFEHKLKMEDLMEIGIDRWVNETEEMTMAHLAEVIKCVAILGNDFDDTIKRMRDMKHTPSDADYNKETKNIGFIGKKVS